MTAVDRVPMLRGSGTAPKRRVPTARNGITYALPRRRLFQAATVAGFSVMSVFPAARAAYADGYDIYEGPCPSYAADHDCSPGCGPSTIFAASCETDGPYVGFHRNDGVTWTLRPNQCYSGTYDGWLWKYAGACGACACSVERRCHDGYRDTGSGWVRSICRWNTDCGCAGTVAWPTVREGDRDANVHSAQHLLVHTGADIEADGIFGPLTESAVRAFQRASNIPQTGTVNARTWAALVVVTRRGDRGEPVNAVQRQLNKHGHKLTVDGQFGPMSEEATRDFQRQNGLTVDGIVGQNTWRTLTGGAA
ncbi:peptidoglycan hydrolase-like protein with peptidoglycan-binding domain [Stackebrandtia endophytica]|uniref:Peptidoglycan hydrolase-like protein with peptidoglycan-binding domain n=1 Tax=Stackebrandtia endophytica TaxID=1496996 RepID=A0A543B0X3_9ACTN|nr:peptidoglycan-binding protein [Stackebrandtia endophytica]TQL78474.1 peptidoglycan hydrolase-like protein with peptidoglycan-binding domain [Stackebrandtia endophytica]